MANKLSTQDLQEVISAFRPLNDKERLDARDKARSNALRRVGVEPRSEHFRAATYSEYPRWLLLFSAALFGLVMFFAASVSAYRVYSSALAHFNATLPGHTGWARFSALGVVAMAEFAVVASEIAAVVLLRRRWQKALAVALTILAASVAFVGNATVTLTAFDTVSGGGVWSAVWRVLETFTPPVVTVFTASALAHLLLELVHNHTSAQVAYRQARAEWQRVADNIEQSDGWTAAYAVALWDAIRRANARRKKANELLSALDADGFGQVRAALVRRELLADAWTDALRTDGQTGRSDRYGRTNNVADNRTLRTNGHADGQRTSGQLGFFA